MQSQFTNQIQKFSAEVRGNFFMPGHKGKLSPLDVTEFWDTGDLTDSSGVFAQAETELAKIFKAERSHILVNGATVGNLAMLMASCQPGDKLLVDSVHHHSIPNAIKLFGIKPVFVERSVQLNSSLNGGINPYSVELALKKDKKIKGMIMTSPTYYGICSDIRAIAEILHSKGKFLLVDEAHGAHFYFSKNLPQTAMEQGADICVVSAHKTLPAPNQTAILNINKSAPNAERIKECLNILQTSSPSFMMISQMLDGIASMPSLSENYEKIIAACEEFAYKVNQTTKATCITWSHMENAYATEKDQTRLVISLARCRFKGKEAFDILWERYKIRPEMYDDNNIVCIVTAYNSLEDLDNLYNAILELCGGK